MSARSKASDSQLLLRMLAEFRYELRSFLLQRTCRAGSRIAAAAAPTSFAGGRRAEGETVTIAYAAERLGLKHNSAVELVNRSEREGLLVRTEDTGDQPPGDLARDAQRRRMLWNGSQTIMRGSSMSWRPGF